MKLLPWALIPFLAGAIAGALLSLIDEERWAHWGLAE